MLDSEQLSMLSCMQAGQPSSHLDPKYPDLQLHVFASEQLSVLLVLQSGQSYWQSSPKWPALHPISSVIVKVSWFLWLVWIENGTIVVMLSANLPLASKILKATPWPVGKATRVSSPFELVIPSNSTFPDLSGQVYSTLSVSIGVLNFEFIPLMVILTCSPSVEFKQSDSLTRGRSSNVVQLGLLTSKFISKYPLSVSHSLQYMPV